MVDDKFRSYRNRDSVAREESEQTSCEGLLAELARLTGLGDPYADGGGDGASSAVDYRDSVAREGSEHRAIVGPFASMEEAAGVCSTLKAAGGNCRVERD